MTIIIADTYTADGPFRYSDSSLLISQPGVYVILGQNDSSKPLEVIDVGSSNNIRQRIETHDRASEWMNSGYAFLSIATINSNQLLGVKKEDAEKFIRVFYNPPIGQR